MYQVNGFDALHNDRVEVEYFQTWEEVLSLIAIIEEGMYRSVTVVNLDTNREVLRM